MGESEVLVSYKCRRCGGSVEMHAPGDKPGWVLAEVMAGTHRFLSPMMAHGCKDGAAGVADIVGCVPKQRVVTIFMSYSFTSVQDCISELCKSPTEFFDWKKEEGTTVRFYYGEGCGSKADYIVPKL